MKRIRSELECPVCFNIPRELPIPSCHSGHFVCRPCKKRVRDCPTCRKPMPAHMTNSVVGALIEQVEHKCKYSDQGCEVKMMLKDLVTHEKECPKRTFKCPYDNCRSIVNLSNFNDHFLNRSFNLHSSLFASGTGDISFRIPENNLMNYFCMHSLEAYSEFFHVRLAFSQPQNCYALSVWSSAARVTEYRANLSVRGNNMETSMKGLLVTSVENVPSNDECMDENGKYFWCIPLSLAKNFMVKEEFMRDKLDVFLEVTK